MKISINNRKINLNWLNLSYFSVLTFFLIYIASDLNYNSAFVDEAIYSTIGEEVLRDVYWERAISWMGGSYFYPLMSAYVNRLWGLTGVRFMSMLLILLVGIISGEVAKQIAGKKAQVLAALLFFTTSISLDLAQLGTYDTPAIAFLMLSTYAALHSRYKTTSKSWSLVIISSIFFTLSVYSKYITAIFAPLILLLIFASPKGLKFSKSIIWSMLFAASFGVFVYYNQDDLISLYNTSPFVEIKPRLFILGKIAKDITIQIPLAIVGAIYAATKLKKEKKKLIITLFLAGLTPIVFHLATANARSLWKHMVITVAFWAPISSFILLKLSKNISAKAFKKPIFINSLQLLRTIVVVALVTNIWVNFSRHWRFQRSWPSATAVNKYLKINRKSGDIVFAEASAIHKYHLFDGFEDPFAWPSTWFYQYEGTSGPEAMIKAINNQEFDFIVLSDYFTSETNKLIAPAIEESYELVLTDTFKVSGVFDQTTRVWIPKQF